MESRLTEDLRRQIEELKLPSTAIRDIECRSSSCRVEYTFTKADLDRGAEEGAVHPVELLYMKGGHVGSLETDVELPPGSKMLRGPDTSIEELPDGSYRKAVVYTFSNDEMDPNRYQTWREQGYRELLERQKSQQ
jgi:hypothetical protein